MKKPKAIYSELAIAKESAAFWASQMALVAQLVKNLGRSPRERLSTSVQLNEENSGLERSMNFTVLGVAKSRTQMSDFHFTSGGVSDKNLPVNWGDTRDTGSIPGLGRSPGGGQGNPLQCSYLENPMDRGVWRTMVHTVAQSWTRLRQLSRQVGRQADAFWQKFKGW